ncbi:uncharacterized protein LOC110854462 isoform X2 [Folsomia candida]|uniref:uncharacterized protein LOC110854462 isoform X2 n=1 Tax=Folsomia candida TaxID=158441 RepID=UPI00160545F6|nr:uncharacterized protein LOC110854462 isoform X2 [Folsomia candida]
MEPSTSSYGVIPEKNLKIWGTFQDVGAGGEKILKTAKLAHVANYDHGFVVTMTDETYCFTRAGAGGYRISKIRELSGIRVKVTGSLTGVKVRQVALPGWYKRCTVALSVGGEVHHWGSACGSSNHPWRPTSIPREHFDYQDVTSITCSAHMCVALTSKGELYQWKFGDMMPQKVFIDGSVPLKKITGTSDFIVALTVKGELHYVEIKAFSRLLANTRTSAWRAIFKDYKIEDIASCGAEHVVVVELKDSTRFAFSYCQEDYPERPFIPSFTLPSDASMDELFAKCGDTCNRTISAQIEPPPRRRVSDDICDLWENKKHADVAFSVGGKVITAHMQILACRKK